MKISVHLEADSAEELLAFFATFHVKPDAEAAPAYSQPAETVIEDQEDDLEKQIRDYDALRRVTPEAPTEPEQPVKKARKPRGPNKQKASVTSVTPEEPVITPPVGPAPVIEVPKAEPVSRQELLDVFSEYVQRYGVSFGYTDISNLLQKNLGDGIRKASDVPDEALGEAVTAIRAAINDNPFNRKRDYA